VRQGIQPGFEENEAQFWSGISKFWSDLRENAEIARQVLKVRLIFSDFE
jgi:hypothetical protein